MFKNRKITVTVDKKNAEEELMASDPESFEKKTTIVLHQIESIGKKVFVGICIYVILDTARKVAIEQSKTYYPDE